MNDPSTYADDGVDVTRVPVALEGKESVDGRLVEQDALILPIGPVPVTHGDDHRLVGKALGFERDHGTIYARFDIEADADVPPTWTPSLSTDDLDLDTSRDDLMVIRRARIRGVHLLNDGGSMWPEINRS
jgi:hypothetical protein